MSTDVTEHCLQCGGAIRAGSREVTVRSTANGQLAFVHQDCLGRWLARGPMPVLGLREI